MKIKISLKYLQIKKILVYFHLIFDSENDLDFRITKDNLNNENQTYLTENEIEQKNKNCIILNQLSLNKSIETNNFFKKKDISKTFSKNLDIYPKSTKNRPMQINLKNDNFNIFFSEKTYNLKDLSKNQSILYNKSKYNIIK